MKFSKILCLAVILLSSNCIVQAATIQLVNKTGIPASQMSIEIGPLSGHYQNINGFPASINTAAPKMIISGGTDSETKRPYSSDWTNIIDGKTYTATLSNPSFLGIVISTN